MRQKALVQFCYSFMKGNKIQTKILNKYTDTSKTILSFQYILFTKISFHTKVK